MSQKIPYCGGEAYLVDQVLLPCGDISAVMGEIANIPSPCRNNVEGVLNKNSLSYFNALLLATGVQRPVFSSVRNFTLFAPSDKAIQQAFRSGALNYPYLFARNKTLLEGIVAYHAVPQFQFAGPSKQTLSMKTLLSEVGAQLGLCLSMPPMLISSLQQSITYANTHDWPVSAVPQCLQLQKPAGPLLTSSTCRHHFLALNIVAVNDVCTAVLCVCAAEHW
jgi:hypothetical protein